MTPTLTDRYRSALRAEMRNRGLTERMLALRVGVEHTAIHRFLAGRGCTSRTLDAIDAFLEPVDRPPMRGSGLVRWAPA